MINIIKDMFFRFLIWNQKKWAAGGKERWKVIGLWILVLVFLGSGGHRETEQLSAMHSAHTAGSEAIGEQTKSPVSSPQSLSMKEQILALSGPTSAAWQVAKAYEMLERMDAAEKAELLPRLDNRHEEIYNAITTSLNQQATQAAKDSVKCIRELESGYSDGDGCKIYTKSNGKYLTSKVEATANIGALMRVGPPSGNRVSFNVDAAEAAFRDYILHSCALDNTLIECMKLQNANADARVALERSRYEIDETLLIGVMRGDLMRVRAALTAGAKVNTITETGRTVLMESSEKGHLQVVRELLRAGADVNAKTSDGDTALMLASGRSTIGIVRTLISAGADVNVKDKKGVTALMLAAINDQVEIVEALLGAKADINAKVVNGTTALMMAASHGYGQVVRVLIEAKADVNAKKESGYTSLMMASGGGHTSVVRSLLSSGADVNAKAADGATALILASQQGHVNAVSELIDGGADVNSRLVDGSTALIAAATNGHIKVVDFLLDAKAVVSNKTGKGDTALKRASRNGHSDVVQRLNKAGARE